MAIIICSWAICYMLYEWYWLFFMVIQMAQHNAKIFSPITRSLNIWLLPLLNSWVITVRKKDFDLDYTIYSFLCSEKVYIFCYASKCIYSLQWYFPHTASFCVSWPRLWYAVPCIASLLWKVCIMKIKSLKNIPCQYERKDPIMQPPTSRIFLNACKPWRKSRYIFVFFTCSLR